MNVYALENLDEEIILGVYSTPDKAISGALQGMARLPGDERRLIAQEVLNYGSAVFHIMAFEFPTFQITEFSLDAWYGR